MSGVNYGNIIVNILVIIFVFDVNDNTFIFNYFNYIVIIQENMQSGVFVIFIVNIIMFVNDIDQVSYLLGVIVIY